ncbi:hypothetical protein B5S31_g5098 [[Candida] boidinii]|nr:hypothetical protein B5S31_g5098 [[Candida] boidinii]
MLTIRRCPGTLSNRKICSILSVHGIRTYSWSPRREKSDNTKSGRDSKRYDKYERYESSKKFTENVYKETESIRNHNLKTSYDPLNLDAFLSPLRSSTDNNNKENKDKKKEKDTDVLKSALLPRLNELQNMKEKLSELENLKTELDIRKQELERQELKLEREKQEFFDVMKTHIINMNDDENPVELNHQDKPQNRYLLNETNPAVSEPLKSLLRKAKFETSLKKLKDLPYDEAYQTEIKILNHLRKVSVDSKQAKKGKRVIKVSEFTYKNFDDIPTKKTQLPPVPEKMNYINVNEFVHDLTNYYYLSHDGIKQEDKIEKYLIDIVENSAELLTKQSGLDIVGYLNYNCKMRSANYIMRLLNDRSGFKFDDEDFANQFIMFKKRGIRTLDEKLQRIKNCKNLNNNSWYSIFKTLKDSNVKDLFITDMNELGISLKPILKDVIYYFSENKKPNEMLEFVEEAMQRYDLKLDAYINNKIVNCYVKNGEIHKGFQRLFDQHYTTNIPINPGSYSPFLVYFINNGEFYYALAMANLFLKLFNVKVENVFAKRVFPALKEMEYFDNWYSFSKIIVEAFNRSSSGTAKNSVTRQQFEELETYAALHNIPQNSSKYNNGGYNFLNPTTIDRHFFIDLKESLKWDIVAKVDDTPGILNSRKIPSVDIKATIILELNKNSDSFKNGAKLLGAKVN